MNRYLLWVGSAAIASALTMVACGGGDSSPTSPSPSPVPAPAPAPSPSPSPAPSPSPSGATITITSSGVSPKTLEVSPGTRVTFVNNDSRTHEMASDPHPVHTDCPEINQVGFLSQGQSRQTGALNTVRTCDYHDHIRDSDTNLQGTIVIR